MNLLRIIIGLCFSASALASSLSAPPLREQIGIVISQDNSAQAIVIRRNDNELEKIPFARWTEFSQTLETPEMQEHEIDATDLRAGDRIYIQFDSNGAVAMRVLVLAQQRSVSVKTHAHSSHKKPFKCSPESPPYI